MTYQTNVVKYILHFFNVLMIIAGVFTFYHISSNNDDLPGAYIGYMYFVGAIGLLYGVLGFLGICKDNVCIMKVYAVIILISVITQIIGMCCSNKFEELISEKAVDNVNIKWQEEINDPGMMNRMQRQYKCCGKDSPNDYIDILHRPEIPKSCYSNKNVTDTNALYKGGCLIEVPKSIVESFSGSDKLDWAVIILTFILFGFALYLTIHFMNKKRRGN